MSENRQAAAASGLSATLLDCFVLTSSFCRHECVSGTTTIGGVVSTSFAPKIPPRRKAGEGAAAAGGAGSANLSDLITVKEEKKYVPRARLSSTAAPSAARVAFQP